MRYTITPKKVERMKNAVIGSKTVTTGRKSPSIGAAAVTGEYTRRSSEGSGRNENGRDKERGISRRAYARRRDYSRDGSYSDRYRGGGDRDGYRGGGYRGRDRAYGVSDRGYGGGYSSFINRKREESR